MIDAVLYGRPTGCVFCDRATKLLDGIGAKVTSFDVTDPEIKSQLLEQLPTAKTVPQIWLNGSYVGGWKELVDFLEERKRANSVGTWIETGNYGQEGF